MLLFGILVVVGGVVGQNAESLPLNGSPVSGSISFDSYNYYYFQPPQSGNVVITTTVTGGDSTGVWTFVGSGYYPIDGNSDWDMGAIAGYPESFSCDNLNPNITYYVAVMGIGNSEDYTVSAVLHPEPFIEPVQLFIDDIPFTSSVIPDHYTGFYFVANATGNYTVQLFANSKSDDVIVLGDGTLQPTMGQYEWILDVKTSKKWEGLTIPYIRKGTRINITVYCQGSSSFYIKVVSP